MNYTNSAVDGLIVTWYTSILTKVGDIMWIPFPENEIEFQPPIINGDDNELDCDPFAFSDTIGEDGLKCTFEGSVLKIELMNVMESTGLFKLSVKNIKGPPSLRGTSEINRVYTTTSQPEEEISEWTTPFTFQTETAS